MYHFEKKFSSLFQYSERTIASTETYNTSTERSDIQLHGAGKSEGVALLGELHTYLPQKDKVNLMESGRKKKFNLANRILM